MRARALGLVLGGAGFALSGHTGCAGKRFSHFEAGAAGGGGSGSGNSGMPSSQPCTTDLTCGGETPHCDVSTALCVACLEAWQCASGESCIENRCVSEPECTGEADCDDGLHCDPSTLRCTDCITDAHCESEEVCADGECRPACTGPSECPSGEHCHPSLGHCVECYEDAQCPEGFCERDACRSQVCSPGTRACAPDGIRSCAERGDRWEPAAPCAGECSESNGIATCDPGAGGAGDAGAAGAGAAAGTASGSGGSSTGGSGTAGSGTAGSGGTTGAGGGASGAGGTGGSGILGCDASRVFVFEDCERADTFFEARNELGQLIGGAWAILRDGTGQASWMYVDESHPAGGSHAMRCTGGAFTNWGGGCLAAFSSFDAEQGGYDAVQFWARSSAPLNVRLVVPDRSSSPSAGCNPASDCVSACCSAYFGFELSLGPEWTFYRIRFDQFVRIRDNGPPLPFDASGVRNFEFRVGVGVDFEMDFDDLGFATCDR